MKRFAFLILAGALLAGMPLFAAAPVFSNSFVSVTLDGVRLGTDTDPSNYSMFPSVVYDPSSGLFHMWVANSSALSIEGLRHATSSDGVHFVSDGSLSFAGGNPFPAYGAPAEPQFEFPRAAKIGDDWKLLIWTENGAPGQWGDYNYNESVNDIGPDPSTLAVTHQGPIYPTNGLGTYGQTTGPFGIVDGKLYVQDDRIGGLSKWEYTDTTPPSVTPPADTDQDLITGTGYVYFLTHPGDPLGVYVHNVARVLDQGDGTLGVYYALRHPDGSRVNKQIYYAQSGDGGQTWSAPVGLFSNGDAVRVDGLPNQFDFSHPEVTHAGSRRVLYFSTKAADGAFVVATSAAQPPQTNSWADLLGSGQGAGESGRAVARTGGGGYAIAGGSTGFSGGQPGIWLVQLDGTGEVLWQKVYQLGPGAQAVNALVQAPDGGLVLAGTLGAGAAIWVLKVNALGALVWGNAYATNDSSLGGLFGEGNGLIVTADGGFAVAGRIAGYFGLMKLDAGGGLQWIRAYPAGAAGGAEATSAAALAQANGSGSIAAIGTFSSGSIARVLFADSTGSVIWEKTIGNDQRPPSSIVAGQGPSFAVTGTVANAPWALQIDTSGNISWQNTYAAQGASSIAATNDGRYAIATNASPATLFEIENGQGSPVWAKKFAAQTSSLSAFHGVALAHDSGFVAVGEDVAGTDSRLLAVKVDADGDFVGCLDVETTVPIPVNPTQLSTADLADVPLDEAANTTVSPLSVTVIDTDAAERVVCRGTLPAELAPTALAADPTGNGVADPGERFVVAPSWENEGLSAISLAGHTSIASDGNGLDTSDPDVDASYGAVASLGTSDCFAATGDCYQFGFQNIARPSQHWDTQFDETLSTSDPHHRWAKRWTVHAGLSFSDVSPSSGFYPFIEDIFHNGITGGCGVGIYCPASSVTRAQMAVFLLKSKHGASFVPPACAGVFGDVACPSLFADWIEELYAEGVTGGCSASPLLYCPDNAVTRQQMSAFLLKSLNGSGYVPPPAAGIFGDVPLSNPFASWIEDLYNRQITAGCSASPLLYCPADPNTRQQMAVFLTKTFSLLLYGP